MGVVLELECHSIPVNELFPAGISAAAERLHSAGVRSTGPLG